MQLYILGDTPQERGSQLETLIQAILKHKGYSHISVRHISSGGHEIDVVGEYLIPSVRDKQRIKVVCECKAHTSPISMPDWLKFLGKIYVEESTISSQVNGCFVSLSGVNGNVAGSYENLKENKKDNIELISGEDLETIVQENFKVIENSRLETIISQLTSKKIINHALAYYQNQIYWIISLSDDCFSVIDSKGHIIQDSDNIIKLAQLQIAGKFIDLKSEKKKADFFNAIELVIFTVLCLNGTRTKIDDLPTQIDKFLKEIGFDLIEDTYLEVIESISKLSFVKVTKKYISLQISNEPLKIKFLRHILTLGISSKLLSSEFYKKLFNESFLSEIEKIQLSLKIPEQYRDMCIKLLYCSPSSLYLSLHEIPIITVHKKNKKQQSINLDEHDSQIYLRIILENFIKDFENPHFTEFYYSSVGLEEIDYEFVLKAKTKNGIYFENSSRKRPSIGEADKSIGGGLIRLLKLNDAPEPWDQHQKNC